MLPATKRKKISFNAKENENYDAESGFHSQVDFSSITTSSSSSSLSDVSSRRKSCLASSRGSYQQQSFSESQQSISIGFGSASTSGILISPAKRDNRKRKSELSETDENFYNSYQFVSPLKIRKRDPNDKNCAKLILKEKCSSENVILSSTPIRTEQKASKWGKFRSFHPEKLQFGKSLDEHEPEPATAPVKINNDSTFNYSSFNLSNTSFNNDIPSENVQNLLAAEIKTEPKLKSTITTTSTVKPQNTRHFYNGKARLDILGELHPRYDIIANKILDYLDPESLLRISHVSKVYRELILSNKIYETKRKSYLKHHRSIVENKYPSCGQKLISSSSLVKKKAFGPSNLINQSQMILRQRPITPPYSPRGKEQQVSKKMFFFIENVHVRYF